METPENLVYIKVMPTPSPTGRRFPIPAPQTENAAGMDLVACLDESQVLLPWHKALIPCGFALQMPEGFEAQIRPRSGLALKHSITCLNSPGTIDADYRGQVHALLINLGPLSFTVQPGMRIAQMVIQKLPRVCLQLAAQLDDTTRGAGGFGSTGQ